VIATVRAFGVSAPGVAPETDAPYALSGYGLATSDNVLNLNLELCEQGPSPRNDPFTAAASLASGVEQGALGVFRFGR